MLVQEIAMKAATNIGHAIAAFLPLYQNTAYPEQREICVQTAEEQVALANVFKEQGQFIGFKRVGLLYCVAYKETK